MKNIHRISIYYLLFILSYFHTQPIQAQTLAPSFKDNGRTIDSLKTIYQCETIECENSADKKKIDSCITVYLINSKYEFPFKDINNGKHLQNIAVSVLHALTNPQAYKTIYVFVTTRYKENEKVKTMTFLSMESYTKGL